MSFHAMRWAWGQDLSTSRLVVLLCLADHFNNDEGAAWPSIERIANMTKQGRSTVIAALNDLEAAGLIHKETRDIGGRQTSNVYRLAAPPQEVDGREESGVQERDPSRARGPGAGRGGSRSWTPGGPGAGPLEPVSEPVPEPVSPPPPPSGDTPRTHPREAPGPKPAATGGGAGHVPSGSPGTHPPASGTEHAIRDRLRQRIVGTDGPAIRQAIAQQDLPGLVAAYGGNASRGAEWTRDAAGRLFGELAAILAWRVAERSPVREPSGLRSALRDWDALPLDQRRAWCGHVERIAQGLAA